MVALWRWLNRLSCLLLVTVLTSCYESSEPLSKPGTVLDHALLGNWQCTSDLKQDDGKKASIAVFQFDDSQYYIEWTEGDHVTRYRAYPTLFDKSVLVNVHRLSQNAGDGKWTFVRYRLSQTNDLKVAIVNAEALPSKNENEALMQIRKRIADDGLYSPLVSCTRQKP